MKPRLRMRFGIWQCTSAMLVGYGYTPKQAFDDWVAVGGRSMFHGKHMHG